MTRWLLFALLWINNCCALELDLGVNATNSTFTIYENNYGQTGRTLSELESRQEYLPFIRLSTAQRYLDDSRFGYEYFLGYAQGESNTDVNNPLLTNPSPIKTSMIYGGGTVYYNVNEKQSAYGQHMIGLGLGVGYLKANGTVSAALMATGVAEDVNINAPGFAVDVVYRYENDGWFFQAGAKGVRVTSGAREYQANDVLVSFGKIFHLEKLPQLFE